jgi:hypothetical protein
MVVEFWIHSTPAPSRSLKPLRRKGKWWWERRAAKTAKKGDGTRALPTPQHID